MDWWSTQNNFMDEEAKAFCEINGLVLGSSYDLCSDGIPYSGIRTGEDQWVAVSDAYNEWVQIGDGKYSACVNYQDVAGGANPDWGTDYAKETYEANYILCITSSSPADEVNNCTESRGEYQGTPAPGRCTFDACRWARGFVRVNSTTCITEELPGCDTECARAKCEGTFTVGSASFYGGGGSKSLYSSYF